MFLLKKPKSTLLGKLKKSAFGKSQSITIVGYQLYKDNYQESCTSIVINKYLMKIDIKTCRFFIFL